MIQCLQSQFQPTGENILNADLLFHVYHKPLKKIAPTNYEKTMKGIRYHNKIEYSSYFSCVF